MMKVHNIYKLLKSGKLNSIQIEFKIGSCLSKPKWSAISVVKSWFIIIHYLEFSFERIIIEI